MTWDTETMILTLRLGVVGILYLFLFGLFVLTIRELQSARGVQTAAKAAVGHLIMVQPGTSAQPMGGLMPLGPVTRLGRREDNNIVLDDDSVSAAHALVVLKDGRWWVRDVGSTNGTIVNGTPIKAETVLNEGDELQVGQVLMRAAL